MTVFGKSTLWETHGILIPSLALIIRLARRILKKPIGRKWARFIPTGSPTWAMKTWKTRTSGFWKFSKPSKLWKKSIKFERVRDFSGKATLMSALLNMEENQVNNLRLWITITINTRQVPAITAGNITVVRE